MILSQHRGDLWCDTLADGLQAGIAASPHPPRLFFEYLDVLRLKERGHDVELSELLRKKHLDVRFDAIVVADDQALEFIVKYRDKIAPGIPVVFCAVNQPGYNLASLPADYTGSVEVFEYQANIDLIRRLRPGTRQIFVMVGDNSQGRAVQAEIARLKPLYPDGFLIPLNITAQPLDQVLARLAQLPTDAAVMARNFDLHNSEGRRYFTSEIYQLFAGASTAPTFAVTAEHLVSHGVIGGLVSSGEKHAHGAARQLLRVLDGTPVAKIPLLTEGTNRYVLDYPQLVRWGIALDRLPPGATIINRPQSYYEKHRQVIWISVTILSLQFLTIAFLVRNIRQRRRYAQALAESERLYKALVETAPNCVLITDDARLIQFVSPRTLAQFGFASAAALIGRPLDDLLAPASRPALRQACDELRRQRRILNLEVTCLRQSGEAFEAELDGGEIQHTDRQTRAAMFTLRDVTDKKQLQQQLFRSQRLDSLGALAGGVAHDLNNILTPILLSISSLKQFHSDPELLETLRPMELSVKRGAGVLRQLLMFSRGQNGDTTTVSPEQIVTEALEILAPSLPPTIRRHLTIHRPVPAVQADATQLHQVLLNLILNARDAMPTGGDLTVTLGPAELAPELARQHLGTRPGPHALFTITDTGSGMSPEVLEKIYEPFFTTKAHGHGTGLGLSVVLAILKNHGGFLTVTSTPGLGTTFHVYLPALTNGTATTARSGPSHSPFAA